MPRLHTRFARKCFSTTRNLLMAVTVAGLGATQAQAELSNGTITLNHISDGTCIAGPNANRTSGRVDVSYAATSSFTGEYLNLAQWEEGVGSTGNIQSQQATTDGETLSGSTDPVIPASDLIGTVAWYGLYGDFRDAGTGHALTESPLEPGTTPLGTFGTFHYTSIDMASDPDCANTKAPLTVTGNGAVISNGDSTPSTLDRTNFGSVALSAGAITRTFELEPGASGVPTISSVALGAGSSSAFSLTSGFSGTLSNGTTQEVTVSFDPATAGEHTGTLVVTGPNIQTYSFTIKGTGTGEANLLVYGTSNGTIQIPDGDTTPTTAKSTDYGDVEYGGSNSPRNFLLFNSGTAALAVNNISITAGQGFAVTSSPALTIGAGGSSGMTIRFNPPGVGDYTATVTVTTSDPSSPYTFNITGSGVDTVAPTAVLGDFTGPSADEEYTSRVEFSEPVTGFTTDDLILINATAEITQVSASIYDVVLTPDTAGDFGYSIQVSAVQDLSGQANTAVFGPVIESFSGTPAIQIVSDNQPVPPGSTTPSTLNNTDFGTFEHPASTSRTFTIRNTGSARLAVSDIRDGSAAFTPSRGSVFVEPGEFALLTIFYAPSAPGTHQTTIQMTTNVPTQSTYNFAIKAVSQDTTAPQTTLAPLSGPVNGVYTTTLSFSEPVNPFQGNELTLINAAASVSGSGDSYTVTVTPLGSGTVSVAAPLGLTEDTWGNDSTAAGPVTAEFDETPPSATLSALSGPVNGVYSATLTFSEAVTGLTEDDLTLVNASATLSGSGDSYTLEITPDGDGLLSVTVPADVAEDGAGNGNTASVTREATFDGTAPTATLSVLSGPVNGVYSATLTFSEAVTGLTESDLALVNASASLSGSGDSYTLEITPDGDGLLSVTVPADVAEDGAGNGNTASVTREATFDGTAPTFTLGDLEGPQNGNQFTSRVTFSEPVTGFALADLDLTNATAELTPVSSTVYDIVLTAQAAGNTGYGIGAGAVEDAAGNANTATGSRSIAYGGLPGIELRGDGSLIPPDSADTETGNGTDMGTHEFPQGTTRQFTISNPGTASLSLSQISDDDDNFSASAASMSIAPGESTTLTVTFAPVETGSHSATIQITSDAYGQASYSFEVSAVSQDTTAPETTLAALTGPVSGVYTTTISFSEEVTGFTGDDLELVNATASVSGSGDSYTVTVTPSGQGTVSVTAPAGMTEDASGNPSTADGPVSAVYDTVAPQVTLSELAGPTSGIYTVTVTFSEPVTGLTEQDLNLVNATPSLTGSGADYVIELSPLADGLVSLNIPADAAQDAAGNGNVASQTRQATYDTTGPSADLSPLSGPVDGVYTASLTFSEPVSGLSESGLSLVNATASVTGSGQDYSIEVTPSGPGLFSVQVQANAATDEALNGNTASVTRSATYDGIAPTVQLSTDAESYSGAEDLSVTVTFSEPVTGFATSDVQISGGAVTGLTGSGADYQLSVRSSGTGDLSVQLPAGAAEDGAGNLSEASNLLALANTVVEESREAIAQFLIQRNAALLASQPDLTDLLSGNDTPRSFALQARPGMLSFSFDGALSRSVWMELEARRSTSDGTRSDYLFGVIGAHAIASERLVAGVMLQFDHMATSAADPAIEGSGWLAGPYVAGQIADQPLRYEARLLYGQTRNRITVGGAPEARFSTERWLAQARLEGSVERGIYRLEPSVGIAHVQDRQAAYNDGFGNPVAGQSAALTEVDLGLDVSWPVDTATGALEMTGGVAVVWGKTHTENAPTTGDYDIDGLRGRLTFGLSGQTHDGMTYALGLDYDGLGSDHESFGAKLEVSLRF